MKTIFYMYSRETGAEVGIITIEGEWGDPLFRKSYYQILERYEDIAMTKAEARSLSEKVNKE